MVRTNTLVILLSGFAFSLANANADPPCLAPDFCAPEIVPTQTFYSAGDVALKEDLAIVSSGPGNGAEVFVLRNNGAWVQEAILNPLAPEPDDNFGFSVVIDGQWAMVGSPHAACASFANCGAVYVFRYALNEWTQVAKIAASDAHANARFGMSIALEGNWAAIASDEAVYLFEFTGSSWVERQKLIPVADSDENNVAMASGRLMVGVPYQRIVRFYELVNGLWVSDGQFEAEPWGHGQNVSMDENHALAGASSYDCPGDPNCGAVYRYRRIGADWFFDGIMLIADQMGVEFTNQTESAIEGDWAVIGESKRVFHRNANDSWSEVARLGAPGSVIRDPLSMNGGRILTGGQGVLLFEFDLFHMGQDCDCDGSPDSCDILFFGAGDCQGNGVFDSCDISEGTSTDCDGDFIPDECQNDCQPNGIVDSCDLATGSQDCNADTIPDECELSYFDCNNNGRPDDCDTNDETSIPDECSCVTSFAPQSEPFGWIKNRFISFVPGNPGHWKAIRVMLVSLHHVNPPYTGGPSVPFTSMEGQVRYVGPPTSYIESTSDSTEFYASKLQCTPHYQDWSTIDVLHVTGSAIVPSSNYDVQFVGANCALNVPDNFSAPLTIPTGRWGDVGIPLAGADGTIQPDFSDITIVVDKFKSIPGAPSKTRAKLSSGNSTGELILTTNVGFDSISAVVDSFRGVPYPYTIASCP